MRTLIVAKSLIFNSDHKILLLRRAADDIYRPNGFDLPGGVIEEGEEFTAGALRETLEETGLAVDPASMRLVYSITKPVHNPELKGEVSVVRLFFAARSASSAITVNPKEHGAYYWCDIQEAAEKTDHTVHKALLNYIREHNVAAELWR
jgi:8-oxo-dGTP pyrophosphatase MutT (NUDIX family)